MSKKLLKIASVFVSLVLFVTCMVQAQNAPYFKAVTNLNPAGYWPMHEKETPVSGDIETNYGSLGKLGTGYYNDWDVNGGSPGNTVVIHGTAGALASDSDTAVDFNTGNTSYMLVPHTTSATTLVPPFTMECWFNGASAHTGQAYGDILGEGGATLNGGGSDGPWNGVRIFWAGQIPAIQIYVGNGTGNSSWTSSNYALDAWHYVVLTCDTNDTFTLYVDGNYDSQRTYTNYVPTSWNPLLVGAGYWQDSGPQRQFHGAVDEVAIYTNLLTLSDVETHYAAGTNGAAGDYFTAVTNNHPVLYYRMDSPDYIAPVMSSWPVMTNYGSVALNGHYQPGTLPGAVGGATDSAGQFFTLGSNTNAMPGNGLSSYADAGYNAAFNPTGNTPFSVSLWFKGNPADPRFQTIVGHSNNSWRVSLDQNGKLHFNPGVGSDLISANVYNDGNWHQVVAVYDGSADYLYVDGVLDTNIAVSGTISGSTDDVLLGADPQYIGYNVSAGTGRQFAGDLCEVAFWNGTALDASQIQTLYNAAGVAPEIVQSPRSDNAGEGVDYTNTVVAVGTLPLAYQWYQNNTAVSGQTNASLIYNPLSIADGGNYYVVITNVYGTATSAVATLTVVQAPVITQDMISITKTNDIILFAGVHPAFKVSAVGAVPLNYQWFTNDTEVGGATNTSYTLPLVQIDGLTNFAVVVTNTVGAATSSVVTVTVSNDPAAPYPQAVMADGPLGYWRLNETDDGLGDGNSGAICHDYVGGRNGIYANVALSQPGYSPMSDPTETSARFGAYGAVPVEDNYCGQIAGIDFAAPTNANSDFTIEAWIKGGEAAWTQTNGAGLVTKGYGNGGEQFNMDVYNGDFRFFVRDANGNAHVVGSTFPVNNQQWHYVVGVCDESNGVVSLYVDGQLQGTTSITPGSGILASTNDMTIGARQSSANANHDYQFIGYLNDVAVFNYALSAGQVNAQYVAKGIGPSIAQDLPHMVDVNENGTVTLTVGATGTMPLSYQWNDANASFPLAGATNSTLVVSNLVYGHSYVYYATVTNLYGATNSSIETINVISGAPQIGSPALPPNVFVYSNSVYPYSVTAAGTEPFSYQWYNGGVPISGANQSTYSLLALTNTTITVAITNVYGAVTSNPSMVIIASPLMLSNYAQTIQALGPVGYWPMQETNAPAPSNIETNLGSLGPQANAYYLDSPANPVVGHGAASALNSDSDPSTSFNGQNNCYMAAPAINTNMALNAPFSVELWANPADTSFGMPLAKNGFVGLNAGLPGSGAGNLCGWSVDWARGGNTTWDLQLYHNVASQGNAIQITGPTTAGAVGQWQYVVFTYDGSTVKFYWNGQLITTGSATYVPDTWSPLCVGGGRLAQGTPGNQGVRLYNGLEDEVALYTNVLSAADILAHYQAGTNSSPATPYKQLVLNDHPLVYYRMDAPSYSTPSALDNPALINYGSVPVTGDYPPNTVPGGVAGPDLVGLGGTNVVASPINGLNAAVDAGYVPEFNRTTGEPLTAMIWVKGYPTDGRVQSPMSHGDNSWHFSWDSAGKVHWSSGNSSGEVISSQVVNDGQWHMLAGVYDGSQNLLYVDGALDGTAPAGSIAGSTSDVYLGGAPDYVDTTNEAYFSGSICQAAFFTNALTATQIQNVYNAASPTTFSITYPPLSWFLWGNTSVNAPAQSSYVAGSGYPYRLLLPPNYNPANHYPLIIFLHGGGEVGTNDTSQLTAGGNSANGALALVSIANPDNRDDYPCIFAAPQMPVNDHWNGSQDAQAVWNLVQVLKANYSVDPSRIILTGLSSGGMGCFNIPPQLPSNPFCCFVAMSAYSLYPNSTPKVPFWVFHAVNDPTVSIVSGQGGAGQLGSDTIVPYLRSLGYSVIYTRFNTGGHGIWSKGYQNPQVLPWMMAQRFGEPMQGVPSLTVTNSIQSGVLTLSGTSSTTSGLDFTRIGWASNFILPSAQKNDGTSTGTTSFVSPSSSFDSSYVGQRLSLLGSGTFGALYYDIDSVENPTTITLDAAPAAGTYSFLTYPYGTAQNPCPETGSLTPDWKLSNIPLHPGTNMIQVIGEMPSGNSSLGGKTTISQLITIVEPLTGAPFAETELAREIRPYSAVLSGLAVPNGTNTTAWFEWGTNASYGRVTGANNLGNGDQVMPVNASLTGLAVGVVYHYRLVASNTLGVTYGSDQRFTTGGRVKIWGDDSLGLGYTNEPAGLTNVVAVAAGAYHALALKNDMTVMAWGYDNFGQTNVPPDLTNVIALAAGSLHSLALRSDGTVVAWGDDGFGQTNVPAGLSNVVAVAAGAYHSLALESDGTVAAWGNDDFGQSDVPVGLDNVVGIAAGEDHSLALKADGTVVAWGDDRFGQTDVPVGLSNVVSISAGAYHSLALEADGQIVSWGDNNDSQTNVPAGLTGTMMAVCGGYFNLALNAGGQLAAWGDGSSSQTNLPDGLTDVAQIAGGMNFGLAIASQLPQAYVQTVSGFVNHDLVVALQGSVGDGSSLSYRVANLPSAGTLYQFTNGDRGGLIAPGHLAVSDGAGRLIFAPGTNGMGSPYDHFTFVANDGLGDSLPATITVNIGLPTVPQGINPVWSGGSSGVFSLNFDGSTNATYSIWASTNLMNWQKIGTATEYNPGQYEFMDSMATNWPARFYRLSAP